jgi:hypothetical protein
MAGRAEERKRELIEAVIAEVRGKLADSEADLAVSFIRRYFRDVAPGDVAAREMLDLYGTALAHLRFAETRTAGAPRFRVYNRICSSTAGSRPTVVEIVTDDSLVPVRQSRHGDHSAWLRLQHRHPTDLRRHPRARVTDDRHRHPQRATAEARPESLCMSRSGERSHVPGGAGEGPPAGAGRCPQGVEDGRDAWQCGHGHRDLEPAPTPDKDELAEDHGPFFFPRGWPTITYFMGYAAYALGAKAMPLLRRLLRRGSAYCAASRTARPPRDSWRCRLPHRCARWSAAAIAIAKANTEHGAPSTYLDFIGLPSATRRTDGDRRAPLLGSSPRRPTPKPRSSADRRKFGR